MAENNPKHGNKVQRKMEMALELAMQGLERGEIAARIGVSRCTLNKYLRECNYKPEAEAKAHYCIYSPDCFTCPLPDCRASQDKIAGINKLATDRSW